jgi:hypothetical protein
MSDFHWVAAVPVAGTQAGLPIADFADGGTISDIVCMSKYNTAYFELYFGDQTGGTCTLTLTVVPCDDATPTNTTTAIPFYYKRISAGETNTAWTSSSSFVTTAGDNQMYVIKVDVADLPLVSGVKYEYCYLNIAETTNDPALGGCHIIMADPRYNEATLDVVTA